MPEAPEVQALVEFLGERGIGRAFRAIDHVDHRIVKTRDRPPQTLDGAQIAEVRRFGKYAGIATDAGWLVVSFGRNGWIRIDGEPDTGALPVAHVVLDDGTGFEIVERGEFLAVAVWVVDAPTDVAGVAALGPDPLAEDFSREDLERVLGARRKQIKALLQEQASLAGIGNAYSDEILHRARIAPATHASLLASEDRDRLFAALIDTMRQAAAERRGLRPADLKAAKVAAMTVHGRGGQPCPVCGAEVADHVFGGASAQYCPVCQTVPSMP
ncbi:DNA-formamidopyrimidine glycosylase family protein [uncultured Microbacterium sp.]|uniref:DNA-formamidopyrimidine glycosylase family protein n=1 Tax=uncultured Microbacterium sp. TaxID=191216 RepID=UPI0025DDB749|nr:DNA-formamidopyrimidine glycosylase family protein [uncultured Microbacterium sp.]